MQAKISRGWGSGEGGEEGGGDAGDPGEGPDG